MKHYPEEAVAMAGLRGPLRRDDVLFAAQKANRIAPVQVLRADRIVGVDHLRSAAAHAHRAFAEGRNQADRLEVEFTRYAAGERQIRLALEKLGIEDPEDAAILVALGPKAKDAAQYFLHASAYREDDGLLEGGEAALAAFGFSSAQVEATTAEHRLDLVLEAVAAVDMMRK
jgi:KEOPS complex subunit Cgi121